MVKYQDMNGMKDKFDVALKRIGDEIDKDQAEQNEKNATQWLQITNKDKLYLYTVFCSHQPQRLFGPIVEIQVIFNRRLVFFEGFNCFK